MNQKPSHRRESLILVEIQGDGVVYARAMRWITFALVLVTVPDLSAVLSYLTPVFIARDGEVRWIHSGFAGPGTGRHHEELVGEMEERIELLLSETPP